MSYVLTTVSGSVTNTNSR